MTIFKKKHGKRPRSQSKEKIQIRVKKSATEKGGRDHIKKEKKNIKKKKRKAATERGGRDHCQLPPLFENCQSERKYQYPKEPYTCQKSH